MTFNFWTPAQHRAKVKAKAIAIKGERKASEYNSLWLHKENMKWLIKRDSS